MRRSDREITDENTIKNFIENESIIRIAFCDDGDGFKHKGNFMMYNLS